MNSRSASGRSTTTLLRCAAVLLAFAAALPARAENCSDFPNGIIDGETGIVPPSQIQVDRTCTIRNFPADNPLNTNFSFYTQPGQNPERWLVIFDNVVHTGQMSCNSVHEHIIWFTNGSSTAIQEGCQNLLIPVEKIDKRNPAETTTAAVGVPFTYTLTIPVLFDAGTGTVIDEFGSPNELHSVTVIDDLNATGADLSYVGHVAYWEDTGLPVAHTFANDNGVLTFDNFPIIPADDQMIIELTVVLEDTPSNTVGTQFVNTAKWEFGRLIDGVFYEPLPGEWGISDPLTIAGPNVVFAKTGPAVLNLGQSGDFTLEVRNDGNGDAWNVTVVDRLPDGPTGGMCNLTPEILSAQVFAADGTTPVAGKGPLVEGTDYTFTWESAPRCELTLEMLTPSSTIGPDERLLIDYRTELDPDTDNGITLTNVAGATEWYNGDDSNPNREAYSRPVTNGTVGTLDHQDAHTVTTALSGYFYEKTVANLTDGVDPTTTAGPGDTLRYTLRLQTTDSAINDAAFYDDLGEMNPTAVFVPGSLTLVPGSLPPGANASGTDPSGGTNGAGIVDIRNLSLPLDSELSVQFDITLAGSLLDGQVVRNQADLNLNGVTLASSDDPYVNGQADPDVPGDEDPTRVTIERTPPPALAKALTRPSATIGEEFSYRITVPQAPHAEPIYDVRILDNLGTSAADLEFVSVTRVAGSAAWTPVNTGTATDLVIEDPVDGIDIPAGEQVVVDVTVRLRDTATNVAGLAFTNTASYTYNQLNGDDPTERPGAAGTSESMTVVESDMTLEKSGPLTMRVGQPDAFTLNLQNVGTSTAYNVYISDVLPNTADGGMCDAAPANVTAQVFEADGTTPAGAVLTDGVDYTLAFSGEPACTLTIETLTRAAALEPDDRLIVTYEATLDEDTQEDTALTNIAGATEWFSLDQSTPNPAARTYSRALTDGTVGTLDHEDAHTLVEFTPRLIFEKTAANLATGDDPAITATPGDAIRYRLRIENASDSTIGNFSIVDELDALNASPAFAPGTLEIVTLPAGANAANTDPAGGAAGTGLLDVRGLSLAGLGDSVLLEFDVTLAAVIADGSYVSNQSEARYFGYAVALSDDPNVNGAADPDVAGDEDPTRLLIESAPYFEIEKVSTYLDGDTNVLLAGERLRYTITVRNSGTDHATGVGIADQLPANTAYVLNSTTLNGTAVADVNGNLPLIDGIPIASPAATDPGTVLAAPSPGPDTTVTITFDVVVDDDVSDGTILSNQAFVSAVDEGLFDLPSDDPRTEVEDDPTRDVVGNAPLLFATKSAELQVDAGSPGIVDPGDVLRYTIRIYNNGRVPATYVRLQDDIPADTTYVADTTTQNGLPLGQPDGGVSPLVAGIAVSSADLTPPLPADTEGTLTPGESAVVQFDLQVNAGVPAGTLITNQAVVNSQEVATLLTDGDGNPATGPEPTIVVVGDAQQLSIAKSVSVVGGGPAVAGATLEYLVTVTNVSPVPALYVAVTDDLDEVMPGYLTYVDQSATMNGRPDGVTFAGTTLTADYATGYGPLDPGETATLRFRAELDQNLPIGTRVTNRARVQWNDPLQYLTAEVSIDVGGTPGNGTISGLVFHDADHDGSPDPIERLLEGWTVELLRNGEPMRATQSDADGAYVMAGVVPNYLNGDVYAVRFSAPGSGPNTALLGVTDSDFTDMLQRIDDVIVQGGSNLRSMNMPIDPNGVIYDSIARTPIAGATIRLLDAGSGVQVPADCFDDPNQQGQVTLVTGYYRFDLNFSEPACASGGDYLLDVTTPGSYYVAGSSELIPPASDSSTPPFDVPACPGGASDALPGTPDHCEAQASEFAPAASVPAQSAGTVYFSHLNFDDTALPGSGQIYNNHVPLDPDLSGAVSITKTTPMLNVMRGQLVPYVITVRNSFGVDLPDVNIVDRFPVGFRYVEGSAHYDGIPTEPTLVGRELVWPGLTLTGGGTNTIKLLLAVGAGVSEGKFVNRAQAMSAFTGNAFSEEATATVRIVPDPTFDCTDVTGKVFDDLNLNGYQDGDESGVAGVRVVTARGLVATTDQHGRYHFTCALVPNASRGSNFVLKLDDRTLPSGFRPTTRLLQLQRATRGKALEINFGATIHRVVGLDLSDPVFVAGEVEMREQWQHRIGLLVEELRKGPAVLRLAYVADVEERALVNARLNAISSRIRDEWRQLGAYELVIEPEIFWRLGGPPDTPKVRKK